jgi:hypothetical protein
MIVDVKVTDDAGSTWSGTAHLAKAESGTATEQVPAPVPPAKPTDTTAPTTIPTAVIVPGVHAKMTPADLNATYPGVVYTREFVSGTLINPGDVAGLIRKVQALCDPAWAVGQTPIVSVKLDVDQVTNGKWDSTLQDLGAWLSRRPQMILIVHHEPEDDMTAVKFVPYFNRARHMLKLGYPALQVMYAAMAYQWAPGRAAGGSIAGRTDDPAAWAKVEADLYGIDVYSGRSFPLTAILPEHLGFIRWHIHMIGNTGRKWIVTERGFEASAADSDRRALTISRETDWLTSGAAAAMGCIGYVYWDTPGTESSTTLSLDAAGRRELRLLVSRLASKTA